MQFFLLFFSLFISSQLSAMYEDITYPFTSDKIDVVIPSTEKDLDTLELCIRGIRKNGHNIGRIIIISSKKLTDNAEWFDENLYPFSKRTVALHLMQNDSEKGTEYINKKGSRLGWYYQQLLKLYACFVIPNISPNILILDSDTIFLNPVKFLNSDFSGLYNPGTEYHLPYFEHAQILIPGFQKKFSTLSGISHHMLFQRCVIEDLFQIVENIHQKPMWQAFCECVNPKYLSSSGASEYEIYFNFLFNRCKQPQVRKLKWTNARDLKNLTEYKKKGYHYVSFHAYMRG